MHETAPLFPQSGLSQACNGVRGQGHGEVWGGYQAEDTCCCFVTLVRPSCRWTKVQREKSVIFFVSKGH